MVNNFTVLVNGAVLKDNKVLIIQRSLKEKHQAGKWCLPGGKMEEFDIDLGITVLREVCEETGVVCVPREIVYNNVFSHEGDEFPTLAITFVCDWLSGKGSPLEDTKNIKWISKEEIDQFEFPPNVRNYIEAAFNYEKSENA